MSVQWSGLNEFRAALRNLPAELAEEGGTIVLAHAAEAERLVEAAYPEVTGNLKRGVTLKTEGSRFGAVGIVKSGARHSHLFEKGTGPRRTASGANRGSMPQAPQHQQMIPIVIQVRRRMVKALMTLVERAGFQIVGTP